LAISSTQHKINPGYVIHKDSLVYYVEYIWNVATSKTIGEECSLVHSFVYHNGIIYQSYKTETPRKGIYIGYPPISIVLPESYVIMFKDGDFSKMTVKDFNILCAPTDMQIKDDGCFRLNACHSAFLNPMNKTKISYQ
jgi:hypothetical protein